MPKLAWQSIVAAVVLFAGVWVVRCYGGSQYDRGRREAEAAHTDSVRKWVARGADSVSRASDRVVSALVRENDSLRTTIHDALVRVANVQAIARQASDFGHRVPKQVLDRADPLVRAALDSVLGANRQLDSALSVTAGQVQSLSDHLVRDSVVMRGIQDSRDRWKAAYDTASTEIGQLKAMKMPKKPRFGFKAGFLSGAVVVLGALIAAVGLSH